ncbi:MAG: helix-turn-helix domain-containing protein [Scytonema hyalinum WJT4-NPBG1]|jgi:putative transposase|nr:helix-turn-helix domain-containing protein [Scytonema hyalinum WJT4-NPBG1]
MPCQPLTITLSDTDQQVLEKLANRRSTSQQIAQRARIVLQAALGQNNAEIARMLDISIKMVRQWRRRWVETSEQSVTVMERLQDSSRSGAPLKFTLEQQVECMAMACRDPMEYGRPISHWSAHELASELIKQGIMEQISPRQVGRWLAEAELKPHQSRYWLFPPVRPRV